jgi:hypothetical protein
MRILARFDESTEKVPCKFRIPGHQRRHAEYIDVNDKALVFNGGRHRGRFAALCGLVFEETGGR